MKGAERQAKATQSSISKSMGALKAGVTGFVSALSVGMLTSVIKNALDYAGSLGEVSQQLGVTTKDLQVFRYAAGQSGVSTEEIDKGLGKLTITLGQVAAGAKAPIAALKAIGISADDLRGKDTGQAFRMIADGLQQVGDRSQRAAVEVALFGRTGAKLDTMLSGGSEALNNLADAAEKLGIVLSDKQIQDADKTADKLDAMKTVLQANIAGAVANNAEAILSLANAFMQVVVWAGKAASAMATFLNWAGKQKLASPQTAQWGAQNPNLATGIVKGLGAVNPLLGAAAGRLLPNPKGTGSKSSVTVKLAPATVAAPTMPSMDVPKFLAGGGGGGRKKGGGGRDLAADAERKRLEALREEFQFNQELRRANMDILRAKKDLSVDYLEQAAIAVQILDSERAAYAAELDYEVSAKGLTRVQADQLLAAYDMKDSMERLRITADNQAQQLEDGAKMQALILDLDRDRLESRAQLATTAAEQRAVELQILDLAYRQRKAALEAVLLSEASVEEKQRAQVELRRLGETYGSERQGVINATRGPLEEYLAGVPQTAAQMEEALQRVKVNGIDALVDGMTDVATGAKNMGDVFREVAMGIVRDLIRIQLQKAIVGALGGILGGSSGGGFMPGAAESLPGWGSTGDLSSIPRFARGGGFNILGRRGSDRNMLALNGLPIARVSHGERVNISKDGVNDNAGGNVTLHQTFQFEGVAVTKQEFMQGMMLTKNATIGAIKDMNRRR